MQPTPDPTASAVLAVVFLPFVAAGLVPLVYRALGERTAYYAAAVALACFGLVASQYGTHGTVSLPWIRSLGVSLSFYVDGLSLLVGFLASGVGVLILTYSGGYMHGEPGQAKYYAALLAFMGSMLGVAFAADLVALFVFWELTSLSSFVLIGHYQRQKSSQYAARKSMLITVSGGLFMLVGFLLLHAVTGEFSIVYMLENPELVQEQLRAEGLFLPVLGLVAVGAAAKSAQVPLHIWLPNAMEAPTPVSAFLHSATMVKAGVYLLGRLRPVFVSDEWQLLFAVLGLTTMTVAAILAVGATDIKELLAYSTASHLGLIVAGFGFASELGGETGAFHIINHAAFKAALFLVAGIVAHEAGTRKIENLGGLKDDLPITAAIAAVASLGMAGVPPFNGFYSKELLFEAAWEAAAHAGGLAWVYPAVAVFGSVFTFLYSIRFLMLFFGDKPTGLHKVHSPPKAMLAPPLLLGVVAGLISVGGVLGTFGVHFEPFDHFVTEVWASTLPPEADLHGGFSYYFPDHITPAVAMSTVTLVVGAAAYPFYGRLHRGVNRLTDVNQLRANWYYDSLVFGANDWSDTAAARVQNGLLRTYATWAMASVAALALAGYAAANVSLPGFALSNVSVTLPIALVLGVAIVGAVAVSIAPSHISGVLTLSILGFMVAVFYVLADAPDLALTQLVVETLTLVIFLLVLDKLPAFYGNAGRGKMIRDGALSVVVGATVFVTVLVSTAASPADGIAHYFVETAVPEGGGGNVVNVILVDFRAFDTLGEISVVAMAALSVLTLVAMRERGETQ
ncbi:hydrogen gas-evolving membrane-bound hydrogenase subunit E [Halorussus caseinilyticus]|uniref:hydrogen gas-evolving membrane-bound hydrogenase subunit E n=1 Tax=Halorussus caseinilyticus TaxID=3034025 RepID=UPI0023E84121|nr:hydrogen gas-evolving membrane-bound hydrogenase subunit E [Halorussus sp. DT72]